MVVLIATPGASDANSYVTLAEALLTWADAEESALLRATQLLTPLRWRGARTTTTQALPWPRTGVQYADTFVAGPQPIPALAIPAWLKDAQVALAHHLAETGGLEEALVGVTAVRLADVSIDLSATAATTGQDVLQSVFALIGPYLLDAGGMVKRLIRM